MASEALTNGLSFVVPFLASLTSKRGDTIKREISPRASEESEGWTVYTSGSFDSCQKLRSIQPVGPTPITIQPIATMQRQSKRLTSGEGLPLTYLPIVPLMLIYMLHLVSALSFASYLLTQ
jgi:hypothetical protein